MNPDRYPPTVPRPSHSSVARQQVEALDPHRMNHQGLVVVRNLVIALFSKYAARTTEVEHSFLFQNNRFRGIRFSSGPFSAEWFFDQTFISLSANDELIEQISLPDEQVQRAA